MKKTAENLYPHSATLFRFCKEALEIYYDGNVKVIDQDVGAILGYDPADCSHWKKGKKNIRALSTLRSLADHLRIDEHLLISIAAGKVSLPEAVFEFKGYGDFNLQEKPLELLKKEFFKNPSRWQAGDGIKTFEEVFDVNRSAVASIAEEILQLGKFDESPIYVPEIFNLFPNLSLTLDSDLEDPYVVSCEGEGRAMHCTVRYRDEDMKPYLRFLLVKELFKFLCLSQHSLTERLSAAPKEVRDVQGNIFAGMILIPDHLLRKEVDCLDSTLDFVAQLTDTFWVSKALMNSRLRDYMDNMAN